MQPKQVLSDKERPFCAQRGPKERTDEVFKVPVKGPEIKGRGPKGPKGAPPKISHFWLVQILSTLSEG